MPDGRPGTPASGDETAGPPDWTVLEVPLETTPPGPIEPDPPDPRSALTGDGLPPPGPPGARVFSLEGRPAAGLYLVAWLLGLAGIAVFFVAVLAQAPGVSFALAVAGLGLLGLGFATAAGYQVLARRDRHPGAYRGPSPPLVFGVALTLGTVAGQAGFQVLGRDASTPIGFLTGLTAVAVGYLVAVWLLVVRTGALTWTEMLWPGGRPARVRRIVADTGYAIALMLPATFVMLIVAGLVARLLGVEPPATLPTPRSSSDALAVATAAAIVAPIGEELFFRAFAVRAWLRDLGPRAAVARSAFFFAFVHIANVSATTFGEGLGQALLQFVVILPLGVLLGLLYLQRGAPASIAGHMTYNGLLLVLFYLATMAGRPPAA